MTAGCDGLARTACRCLLMSASRALKSSGHAAHAASGIARYLLFTRGWRVRWQTRLATFSLVTTGGTSGKPQAWTSRLLRCGVAAGPFFVAVFLLEGAARDGYRPLRHPVSSLALGPRGWIQAGNFVVTGTLFLAGAAGLARAGDPATSSRAAPALIGAAGAGLIGAAVFPTDPVSGYPPGTPDALTSPSPAGTAHNLMAVPVFFGLPAAALACSWRSWRVGQRGLALYSAGTAMTMLATMALAAAGFGQSPRLVNLGGLWQRASIITGFSWLTAVSARALQPAPAGSASEPGSPNRG
jgi:hypothetical protein